MKLQIESQAYPKLIDWGDYSDSDIGGFEYEYKDALKKFNFKLVKSKGYKKNDSAATLDCFIELDQIEDLAILMADIDRDVILYKPDENHETNWILIVDQDKGNIWKKGK